MPVLIQNINASIVDNFKTDVGMVKLVDAQFGYEDWFRIGYLEVFIQNFKKVTKSEDLNKNRDFGMNSNRNNTFKTIEISY